MYSKRTHTPAIERLSQKSRCSHFAPAVLRINNHNQQQQRHHRGRQLFIISNFIMIRTLTKLVSSLGLIVYSKPMQMPPKKKMKFFKETFGFLEKTRGDGYEITKSKLLEMAKFQAVPSVHGSYPRERCDFTIANNNGGEDDKTTTTISAGIFSFPSVEELQLEVEKKLANRGGDNSMQKMGINGRISVRNVVGEARSLHVEFPGSIIQAASQFNLLEFPSPTVTPEAGISDYIKDHTQGPACAIACAAGTAYRNYLVPVSIGNRGQTENEQLNGLADLESHIMKEYGGGSGSGSTDDSSCGIPPWVVKNGYVESSPQRIQPLNQLLTMTTTTDTEGKAGFGLKEKLESLLRVGVQEDTTVTDAVNNNVTLTQVYSSAISVGYSRLPTHMWEPIARIVLNATYKATLLVGVLKALEKEQAEKEKVRLSNGERGGGETTTTKNHKPPIVLLTKVGGGVFGNLDEWIIDAISNAVAAVSEYGVDLDVRIVHFANLDSDYQVLE